jgi:alanine racemase
VESGTPVGYSGSFVTARRTRIATLAVGYAQGLPMALSNRGLVAFAGRTAPLIGRISMSLSTVDVTDLPEALVQVGTPAELVGQTILLEEQADRAGMVSNEMLIGLGHGLPRVYRGDPGSA